MTEQMIASQEPTQRVFQNKLTAPLLYLSSEGAGWEGLVAQAYHEPTELEGWITPTMPDISLILFSGGPLRLERRHANGSWKTEYLHQGDLSLRTGTTSYEVRWKSLTSIPTRTLHLHLSKDLFVRTAEEVAKRDPTRLSLVEHAGFQDPLLTQIGLALWRELEQRSPAGNLYAQFTAQMLAVHLLRHYTSAGVIKEPSQGLTQQQMKRVIDFVQDHLDQDLSLEVKEHSFRLAF